MRLARRRSGHSRAMAEGDDLELDETDDDEDFDELREAESEDPTSPWRGFDDPEADDDLDEADE